MAEMTITQSDVDIANDVCRFYRERGADGALSYIAAGGAVVIDLAAEWSRALLAMEVADELDLIDVGIPAELFRRCRSGPELYYHRLIGRETVVLGRNGSYEPHPDGEQTFITPLRRQRGAPNRIDAIWPHASVRWGGLLDLIAWHPNAPGALARRAVDCGADWLGLCEWQAGPIEIRRSPFSWLCGGAVGMVPLDDSAYQAMNIMGCGLEVEDRAHAYELERRGVGWFFATPDDEAYFRETRGRPFFSWGGDHVGI